MDEISNYGVGIDIGGTKIYAALVDINGHIIDKAKVETGDSKDGSQVLDKITGIVENFKKIKRFSSIGIGAAGFVDYKTGIVHDSPNIKFLHEFELGNRLRQQTNIETFVDNDVKMGAYAELYLGEGRDVNDFIFITFGTGIGSSIVIDRKILRGAANLAGEIGHLTLIKNGYLCGCGKRGCFETISSGPAIKRYFLEKISQGRESEVVKFVNGNISLIDVPLISRFAREGDALALDSLNHALHYITLVISYLINLLNPQKIILGGGLLHGLEPVFQNLFTEIGEYALRIPLASVKIVKSKFEDEAISIGAGIYGIKRIKKEI
jgi:glucokinase